jgi:hypothetical protein
MLETDAAARMNAKIRRKSGRLQTTPNTPRGRTDLTSVRPSLVEVGEAKIGHDVHVCAHHWVPLKASMSGPHIFSNFGVAGLGVEPRRPLGQRILSPQRLPDPPPGHSCGA